MLKSRTLLFLLLSFLVAINSDTSAQVVEGTLLGRWFDPTIPGSSRFNNAYNEIWGIAQDGREYAIIGSTLGTHFFDVTEPQEDLQELFMIPGQVASPEIIHRDYHDFNGYLYAVADEGAGSTLQIMDLSTLPDSVTVVYDSQELIRRSHNIFIDTSAAIMYSCISAGATLPFTPLRLFDLSDPLNPQAIQDFRTIESFALTQVHDAFVRNDTAYLNCGPEGFVIADFADPANPILLSSLEPEEYPQSGYNHSGWLTEDGSTYVLADEDHDMDLKVMDVTQLPDIIVLDTIDAGNESPFSIPHNQIIHGDYLFSSYYYDGLPVWDISDLENIRRVLQFSTSQIPHRGSFEGAWGVYPFLPSGNVLVSDMQEGLFVISGINELSGGGTVSTEDQSPSEAWKIYPNPTNGSFNIQGNLPADTYEMSILDAEGRYIQNLPVAKEHHLQLEPGQYYLKIQTPDINSTKKLLIAH